MPQELSIGLIVTEQNKDIIRRWIESRNTNDLETALSLWADEAQPHLMEGFQQFSKTFGDIHVKIDDILCEDNKVALRWTLNAIHQNVYKGIPATNKKITMIGMDIYSIENMKIKSAVRITDDLALLKQIQ